MGLDEELIIEKIDTNLICPVCICLAFPPLQMSCDHVVCEECFKQCSNTCPKCRKEDNNPKKQGLAQRVIGNLKCKCFHFNEGCNWNGCVSDLETHKAKCGFEMMECSFKGCNAKVKRRELKDHQNTCVWRLSVCKYCNEKFAIIELPVSFYAVFRRFKIS